MPKPILSDSLFNADDVATAILAEANLQIANNNLGVSDITNKFVAETGNTIATSLSQAYHFNGFVFINFLVDSTTTSGTFKFMTTNDSDYYPNGTYGTSNISLQGDTANKLYVNTSGDFYVSNAVSPSGSDSTYRINLNIWYRV